MLLALNLGLIVSLKEGQILTNREISRIFDVCACRGIRYKGSIKSRICHIVLIAAFNKMPEDSVRNPYHDRKIDDRIIYTGEGRRGDQKMIRGNLVLVRQMQENFPLYLLEKKSPGKYVFLGRYKVINVKNEIQRDSDGEERKVFIFELAKVYEQWK
jgi:5-methylcytosine-specific restriction protein A